jgi:hypothetical protein
MPCKEGLAKPHAFTRRKGIELTSPPAAPAVRSREDARPSGRYATADKGHLKRVGCRNAARAAQSWESLELIADDRDRLDLNEEIGIGEVLGCDQHARRKLALEKLPTNLDEFVAVRLVADHYSHGHEIPK